MTSTGPDRAPDAPPAPDRALARGRRRVCVLSCPTGWGGAELHTVELVRTLVERGNAVTLVEFGEPVFATHARLPEGVRPVTLRFDVRPQQVSFRHWVRTLRALRCDVAVFAKAEVGTGNLALDLAARLCFPRYIVIEHVSPPKLPPRRRSRFFGLVPGIGFWRLSRIWEVYRRSLGPERIVTVSRALLGELREYWYPHRKLIAIPNGIDSDLFLPDPTQRAASRAAWGVPAEALVFGTVGRLLNWHKAQDIAIDAFAKLRSANLDRDPWYVLVGEGPDRAQLEAQARQAGVSHRVVFAGYTERPWEVQCGFDVFVLPSKMEGTPFALLEAMACGVCPVAMDVGGVADVIAAPSLGWLVPAGDRAGLLAAMQAALLQTRADRAAMARRAREHVEHGFRAREQYGKIAAVLEEG